jgi:hypothetical protein
MLNTKFFLYPKGKISGKKFYDFFSIQHSYCYNGRTFMFTPIAEVTQYLNGLVKSSPSEAAMILESMMYQHEIYFNQQSFAGGPYVHIADYLNSYSKFIANIRPSGNLHTQGSQHSKEQILNALYEFIESFSSWEEFQGRYLVMAEDNKTVVEINSYLLIRDLIKTKNPAFLDVILFTTRTYISQTMNTSNSSDLIVDEFDGEGKNDKQPDYFLPLSQLDTLESKLKNAETKFNKIPLYHNYGSPKCLYTKERVLFPFVKKSQFNFDNMIKGLKDTKNLKINKTLEIFLKNIVKHNLCLLENLNKEKPKKQKVTTAQFLSQFCIIKLHKILLI